MWVRDPSLVDRAFDGALGDALRPTEAGPPFRGPILLRLHRAQPSNQLLYTAGTRARDSLAMKSLVCNSQVVGRDL